MTEPPLRVGVVGVPGGWSSEALADALERRTGYRLLVDMTEVSLDMGTATVSWQGTDLGGLDGLVIKKIGRDYSPMLLDRLEMLRMVAGRGVRVFSDPSRVLRLVDRLSCTVTLRQAGIPVPDTVVTENVAEALAAVRRFGRAVLKPLYSTKARGMLLVSGDDDGLVETVRDFRGDNPVIYVQRLLDIPDQDFGLAFLGGRFIGSYARVRGAGSWNTTIRAGGRYDRHDPAPGVVELARRAQELFGLDFASVDVAETPAGPMIFEVSAFGGFRGLREGVGVDAPELLAGHVLETLRRG